MISHHDVIAAFSAKLAEYGVALADTDRIKLDGQWHRAKIEGDRGRDENLSYKIHFDDRPAGFFQDHKRGFSDTFSVSNGEDLDPAARAAAQTAWRAAQATRDREQAEAYAKAAAAATASLRTFQAAPADHPYLARKGLIPTADLRHDGAGLLVVPLYSDFGVVTSFQTINPDGDKLFMPGGKMAGAFHPIIGANKSRVLVCEGYATGVALNRATGYSVACAMFAGNLPAVVRKMQAKFPDREIVAAVDDDRWQNCRARPTPCGARIYLPDHGEICPGCEQPHRAENAGILAGKRAGVRSIVPRFPAESTDTDFDDWLRSHGSAELLVEMIDVPRGPAPETTKPDESGSGVANVGGNDSAGRAAREGGNETAGADRATADAPDATGDANPRAETLIERPRKARSELVDTPTARAGAYDNLTSWTALGLALSSNGTPVANLDNAAALLEKHPEVRGHFWYDEFLQRTLTTWNTDQEPREWTEADDVRLALWMQRKMGIGRMAVGTARDAVTVTAMAHTRNECREWLDSLTWDRVPRLPEMLATGFAAERNEYTEAVGRCWLVSMVARVLDPGCKVDTMPVFEGIQGEKKSSALQVLVGRAWFAEASESPTHKDFFQALTGKMLVEIGEMDSFSRSEVTTIKRVLSCQTDRYRAPYGRRTEDHPRQGVFAGTTNKDDWNRDETGARRLWPVACTGPLDLLWLGTNRPQLFAEAVARYRAGESWWDVPKGDAEREQEARRAGDEWETLIGPWLTGRTEVMVGDVLSGCLKIEPERWDHALQIRVAKCLRVLGWKRDTVWRGGKAVKVWITPGDGKAVREIPL